MQVEDEPAAGAQHTGHAREREPQVCRGQVVQPVERGNHRIEPLLDRKSGQPRLAEVGLGAEPLASQLEHRPGRVDADHPVPARCELRGEQTRAAAEVEDGEDAVLVRLPELIEERGPAAVAGVDDDLVVDPCQARVRLDGPHVVRCPRILAFAAANSSSVSTPWVWSWARFWSWVAWSSSGAAAGSGGGAYCCCCCSYCCWSCAAYFWSCRRARGRTRRWRCPRRRRSGLPCVEVPSLNLSFSTWTGQPAASASWTTSTGIRIESIRTASAAWRASTTFRAQMFSNAMRSAELFAGRSSLELLGVLRAEGARLGDVEGGARRALRADVLGREGRR